MKKYALLVFALSSTCSVFASEAMKNLAVLGGIASYGYGFANRQDFKGCGSPQKFFYQSGKDSELAARSIGVSTFECDLDLTQTPNHVVTYRIVPTLMLSHWSASSGSGNDSAYEVTLVPRVQYVWALGRAKVDLIFGIGPSYLSQVNIGTRRKSTNFQFSDEFGLGFSSRDEKVRIGFSYRHVSNADIRSPNNNVDFKGVTFSFIVP